MEDHFTLIPAHLASIKPPTLIRRIQMELGALIAHGQMEDPKQGKSVVREGPESFSPSLVFLSISNHSSIIGFATIAKKILRGHCPL